MGFCSSEDHIQEERGELMVSPTGGIPTYRTAHFLRPTVAASTEAFPSVSLFSKPSISDSITTSSSWSSKTPWKALFKGRHYPPDKWRKWVARLLPIYENVWKKSGIYEAIVSSTYQIRRDNDLILKLAERWCVETNTFFFPWAEATVSLEDVMVLGGYSVLGDSVFSPLETSESIEIESNLIRAKRTLRPTAHSWMDHFMGSGSQIEHEAFLALWLSRFALSSSSNDYITNDIFSIAVHLAKGTPIALAPAVLASLYRDLSSLKQLMIAANRSEGDALKNVTGGGCSSFILRAPLHLVQIWAWERFPTLGPLPNAIKCGEPRLARWHGLGKVKVEDLRLAIDSAAECFQWRPYATVVNNGMFRKFYRENEDWVVVESGIKTEEESFALCLRVSEIVGLDCTEQYLPHRVAMQFGLDQDIPGYVPRRNQSPEAAWMNYKRPIQDAKLYVPARLFESDVTTRYEEWWKQYSMPQREDRIRGVVRQHRSSTFKRLPRASCRKGDTRIFAPRTFFVPKCNAIDDGGRAKEEKIKGVERPTCRKEEDGVENGLMKLTAEMVRCKKKKKKYFGGLALAGEVEPFLGTPCESSPSAVNNVAVPAVEIEPVEMSVQQISRSSVGGSKMAPESSNTGLENILSTSIRNAEEISNYWGETDQVPGLELEGRISKLEIVITVLKAAKFS